MRIVVKVFSKLVMAVTIICLLAAASLQVPKRFGYYPYVVLSGSMEPLIHTGSIVVIDINDAKEIEVGEVYSYTLSTNSAIETGDRKALASESGTLVTHRCIEDYAPGWYVFQGDANEYPDNNPVNQKQVVGKYVFSIPQVGYWLNKLGEKGLFMVIIWLIGLNVMSFVLSAVFGNKKEKDEEAVEAEDVKEIEEEMESEADAEKPEENGGKEEC